MDERQTPALPDLAGATQTPICVRGDTPRAPDQLRSTRPAVRVQQRRVVLRRHLERARNSPRT
eukprot:734806-Lingulodinium_polyedra.AAC.1